MKSRTRAKRPMRADAYAGFLQLWLTPPSRPVRMSAEVDAYLRYVNQCEPLSDTACRAIGKRSERAA